MLLSGESSFQFKFRLVGLERINVLFNEIQEQVATKYDSTMPKNVTFRPDAVVDMKQKTSTLTNIKNFFKFKFKSAKEKKENDGQHKILKKASALFDSEESPIRISRPPTGFKP